MTIFLKNKMHKISSEEREIIEAYLREVPVRLGEMAKKLGVTVKKSAELPNNISGKIQKNDGGYKITINKFEFFQRQRFTLAHELSHFLLHKHLLEKGSPIEDTVLYRSGAPETAEYEANRLAAELIIPENILRQKYTELSKQYTDKDALIEFLADEFQVSKSAMEIRLGTVL